MASTQGSSHNGELSRSPSSNPHENHGFGYTTTAKSLKARLDDNAKNVSQQMSLKRHDAVKKWRGESSIQAGSQTTNMSWLYNTITRYGSEGCFSNPARDWVKKRIATEDVASWGSDPTVNSPPLPYIENATMFSSRSIQQQLLAATNPNYSRPTLTAEQISSLYKYSLNEILHTGKAIIEEFTVDFDDDCSYLSSFLILYNDFYFKLRETVTPPPQPSTPLPPFAHLPSSPSSSTTPTYAAVSPSNADAPTQGLAASQYFQSYSYGSLELTDELLEDLQNIIHSPDLARLHSQLEDSKKNQWFGLATHKHVKIDLALSLLGNLLEITKYRLPFVWEEYRETQDYFYLCQSITDTIKQSQQQQLLLRQNNNMQSLLAQAGMEAMSQAGIPPLYQWYPLPQDPVEAQRLNWVNDRGYRSIQLTMKAIRGPAVQRCRGQLYAVFGSGSRLLKNAKNSDGHFFPHTAALPVHDTTQYVFTMVGSQGKCIGLVPIPLAHIIENPSSEPFWYRLRTEQDPMTLFDLTKDRLGVETMVDGEQLASPHSFSGENEVLISWSISTDDPHSLAKTMREDLQSSSSSNELSTSSNGNNNNTTSGGSNNNPLQSMFSEDHLEGFKTVFSDETMTGGFGDFIRGKVSKKKKRFTEDNFNLDLTYILPNIIAMGFPSEGTEGVFRNPLKQVQQFFHWRHPNRYRIYNLCSERVYDVAKFDNRCAYYPFDDHNPPPFSLMKTMCEDIQNFLAESPQNVVAIHCKAGKGRTGTMIAAYLLYRGFSLTAEDALAFYGNMRTSNGHGVTIASQITYVNYFDHFCALKRAHKTPPGKVTLFLERLSLVNLGQQQRGTYHDFTVTIYHPNKIFDDQRHEVVQVGKPHLWASGPKSAIRHDDHFSWSVANKLIPLCDDFRIEIHYLNRLTSKKEKLLHCWLNTRFMKLHEELPAPIGEFDTWMQEQRYPPGLTRTGSSVSEYVADTKDPYGSDLKSVCRLYKFSLDKIAKDVKSKKVDLDFHLELVFTHTSTTSSQRLQSLYVPHRIELTTPDVRPSILLQQEKEMMEKKSHLHDQLLKTSRAVPRHVK